MKKNRHHGTPGSHDHTKSRHKQPEKKIARKPMSELQVERDYIRETGLLPPSFGKRRFMGKKDRGSDVLIVKGWEPGEQKEPVPEDVIRKFYFSRGLKSIWNDVPKELWRVVNVTGRMEIYSVGEGNYLSEKYLKIPGLRILGVRKTSRKVNEFPYRGKFASPQGSIAYVERDTGKLVDLDALEETARVNLGEYGSDEFFVKMPTKGPGERVMLAVDQPGFYDKLARLEVDFAYAGENVSSIYAHLDELQTDRRGVYKNTVGCNFSDMVNWKIRGGPSSTP